ncbi:hypothetical protein AO066_03540 [Pseudomonas fluorescens]|nr:hypothetical protein AO066_03540 [Pseudomonas fluorescens]
MAPLVHYCIFYKLFGCFCTDRDVRFIVRMFCTICAYPGISLIGSRIDLDSNICLFGGGDEFEFKVYIRRPFVDVFLDHFFFVL